MLFQIIMQAGIVAPTHTYETDMILCVMRRYRIVYSLGLAREGH